MVLAERGRASDEKIGDAIEHIGPPVVRAVLDDVFQRGK